MSALQKWSCSIQKPTLKRETDLPRICSVIYSSPQTLTRKMEAIQGHQHSLQAIKNYCYISALQKWSCSNQKPTLKRETDLPRICSVIYSSQQTLTRKLEAIQGHQLSLQAI